MSLLKLSPSYKDYIWGGHRLVEEYHKKYDGDILAESWELSCHPDGLLLSCGGAGEGTDTDGIYSGAWQRCTWHELQALCGFSDPDQVH